MKLFNRKKKHNGVIEVRLLPEKEKRDYILRLVSYTLIMLFVIANFFFIYLPRLDLIEQVHQKKDAVYRLEVKRDTKEGILSDYNQDLYDIGKNKEINEIEIHNLDFKKIINDMEDYTPTHSFIESVNFSDTEYNLVMTIQFDTYFELTQFHKNIDLIEYVDEVETGSIHIIEVDNPDYVDRVKTTFRIKVNIENAPKAGGIYE